MGCVLMDFADALLMVKAGHPELAGWWGKLLGGGGGSGASRVYGVEWDYSDPSPALTRTGDAKRFADPVPATSLTGTGRSPFDQIMPWAGMRMCNITDGEVLYWQSDPQFSETDYDTMVYIPAFWYNAEKDIANHKWRWSISPTERDGYAKHPGSGRYIGRFHSSGSSENVRSQSGVVPLTGIKRRDFRAYSHAKGDGWWMLDIATWSAIQMLYLVEFANFNSQAALGTGQDSGEQGASGGTSGATYHTVKKFHASNQYRWIEDPFSNCFDFADGFYAYNRHTYVGTDNTLFTDGSDGLTSTGITLPSSNNCISGFGYSAVCPYAFIPDSVTPTQNTYVTDNAGSNVYNRMLSVGGNFLDNPACGFYCFNGGGNYDSANEYTGSRLIFIP